MFRGLPSLQKLVRQLQKVPYLASKNVYRVALHFLNTKQDDLELLCSTILQVKKDVKICSICFNLTQDSDICSICSSKNRDNFQICVLETWHDLFAIERAGGYQGVYHILGGSLCPLEGIGPEELNIKSLINRVNEKTQEIIFATNSTPEGEATASFISSKLEDLRSKSEKLNFKISRLASGVPIGSSLEYMDRVTIYKALSGRRPF
ncbi:recombination protein RecR [Candidatus Dependentiae bacterium]|nr:recombination protein RecR [Candidatus Dependentiae bacterium]